MFAPLYFYVATFKSISKILRHLEFKFESNVLV